MASQYTEDERKQRALDASQRYRDKNKEKERMRTAAWRAANPEWVSAYSKSDAARASAAASMAKKPEHYAQKRQAWEEENREHRREYRRRKHLENPEQSRAKTLRHLNKPGVREKIALRVKEAKLRPEVRERLRINKQNRRARVSEVGGHLTRGLTTRLLGLQKGRCASCSCLLKESGHHLDHITPIARGGVNNDENIQLLCPPCNRLKNARDPIEWAQSLWRLL